ncbi:MAG: beta-lactamase family protein [Verrucomicrobia bacterium]|nr:beta-lactamase family protein [Verrucomicrobiota bacterium]
MKWTLALFCILSTWTLSADPDFDKKIHDAVQPFIRDQVVTGAVTLVAHEGAIVHLEAHGMADKEAGRATQEEDLYWIASMTKPIIGAAVLILQDQGLLNIEDLLETHLTEYKDLWLLEEEKEGRRLLKRPSRAITLKDLLTHTSGVPNTPAPRAHSTLGEAVAQTSQQPLQFEPGSKWSYSNSGINALGRVLEVVSGMPLVEFLEQNIFLPLGMHQTTFFPSKKQAKRLTLPYQKNGVTGELQVTDFYFLKGNLWDTKRTVRPSGGLFSTAEDMYAFYQMMLNKGQFRGKRILSEKAYHQLTTTQTGNIKTGFTEGMSWGLGFQVVKEPQGVTEMLSKGTFGHGGAYATHSWGDPVTQTIYILMVQRRGMPGGDGAAIRKAFQQAAIDGLSNH